MYDNILKIQFSIKSTAAVGIKCYSLETVKKKHSNNLFYIINFFNYFKQIPKLLFEVTKMKKL